MSSILIFPKRILSINWKSILKSPRLLIFVVTIALTALFPELGINFKIDLFDLPVERLISNKAVEPSEV